MSIPEKIEVSGWVNVFAPLHVGSTLYPSRELADRAADDDELVRLACVYVEGVGEPEVEIRGGLYRLKESERP